MKILLAPDSFKGTFSSVEIIDMLEKAIKANLGDHQIVKVPMADGGEGTVEALVLATNGTYKSVHINDSLGQPRDVQYGVIDGDTAVIELAEVAGLAQVPKGQRNPLKLSSYGVGELMAKVLDDGFRNIIVGIGGSATNDGGMGMLTALGVKFYANGQLLHGYGEDLERVDDVDLSGLKPQLADAKISVICDVTNPLLGENGATYVYGPQKGAVGEIKDRLEAGMAHYAQVVQQKLNINMVDMAGAGAAGGVGAALGCILKAEMKRGIDAMLDTVKFDQLLTGVDFVVTGEGRFDFQSVKFGKVPVGIARKCEEKGVPVAIIAGCFGKGWEKILEMKNCTIISTMDESYEQDKIMECAKQRFENAAERMFRLIGLAK